MSAERRVFQLLMFVSAPDASVRSAGHIPHSPGNSLKEPIQLNRLRTRAKPACSANAAVETSLNRAAVEAPISSSDQSDAPRVQGTLSAPSAEAQLTALLALRERQLRELQSEL